MSRPRDETLARQSFWVRPMATYMGRTLTRQSLADPPPLPLPHAPDEGPVEPALRRFRGHEIGENLMGGAMQKAQ